VHTFEPAIEHAIIETFEHSIAFAGVEILSNNGGCALHGLIKSFIAANETRKARNAEKLS
jgi:hypothetical protein